MKTFMQSHALLGSDITGALGDERHQVQAHLYVVAKTKKAAGGVLVVAGTLDHVAASHVREMRVVTAPYPNDLAAAFDAGVIDPETPGAYVFSANHGPHIVTLTAAGPVVIGTSRYDANLRKRVTEKA